MFANEARNAALQKDHDKLYDLADAFEIVPSLIADWKDDHLPLVRQILVALQDKYGSQVYDYLSLLDMDDEKFVQVYDSRGGYR